MKLGDRVRTENNTPSSTSDDEGGGEEPGFTGFAKILAITPLGCRPPPVAGEVTGRFESVTRQLTTVTFEGAAAPLVGTPAHPIWSRNHQAWTSLARLHPGERVAALAGPARVLRIATRLVPPTPVFNLEVARLHRYPVTSLGLRVHNDCDAARGRAKRVSSKTLRNRWEKETGQKWPKDPKTERNRDVSHKNPLAAGGTHDIGNIEPLPHDDHVRRHSEAGDFRRWGSQGGKQE